MSEPKPIISNKELEALASRMSGVTQTNIDTAYEGLVFVRGTYERILADRQEEVSKAVERITAFAKRYHATCSVDAAWLLQLDFDRIDAWLQSQRASKGARDE